MAEINENISTIIGDIKKLRSELAAKDVIIQHLKKKMDHAEQRTTINNIEISNIPKQNGEDVRKIVKAVCKTLKLDDSKDRDIQAAHRVPRYNQMPNGNIIVNFVSRWSKNCVLMAAKEYRKNKEQNLVAKYFKLEFAETPVFISEHLSPARKQLLITKEIAKEKGYKFVWTKDGQILVKKNETTNKTYTIVNDNDLASLL